MVALHARKQVLRQTCVVQIGVNHDAAIASARKALKSFKIDVGGADGKNVDNSASCEQALSDFFVVRGGRMKGCVSDTVVGRTRKKGKDANTKNLGRELKEE